MIFCRKCRHFGRNRHYARCGHPDNLQVKHDWEREWESVIRNPEQINRKNNCKRFEKRVN